MDFQFCSPKIPTELRSISFFPNLLRNYYFYRKNIYKQSYGAWCHPLSNNFLIFGESVSFVKNKNVSFFPLLHLY